MPPIITLLTDFGTPDNYVGEVKGVLLSRVHGAALLDITHEVPPGDLRAGQYILSRVWHRFPQGSGRCCTSIGSERSSPIFRASRSSRGCGSGSAGRRSGHWRARLVT